MTDKIISAFFVVAGAYFLITVTVSAFGGPCLMPETVACSFGKATP